MSDAPPQPKNRRRIALAIAVLIGALILLFAVEWGSLTGNKPPPEPVTPPPSGRLPAPGGTGDVGLVEPQEGPTPVRAFASLPEAPPEPVADSHATFADSLNDPAHDARRDLGIVAELFAHFLGEFRELPVGNNAEITAALAGDNARGFAILAPTHRAINAEGELTDRWGSPYFFHQLASDVMEIRSFGPDRRRYTEDDVVWPAHGAAESESETAATVAAR